MKINLKSQNLKTKLETINTENSAFKFQNSRVSIIIFNYYLLYCLKQIIKCMYSMYAITLF